MKKQLGLNLLIVLATAAALNAAPKPKPVPGVVIDYNPAKTRAYIGSPSIAILPNGDYVASHDFFGPGSGNNKSAVFGSTDRGSSWKKLADLEAQWWSTLFVHRGTLYILGTTKEYGNIVIRKSTDGGRTWTTPADSKTGLLRDNGQYHCAPMPVIEHDGRLWRGFERRNPPIAWGITFCAGMISAPADADLLDASSWTSSNFLPSSKAWLDGGFGGWLEGNAVLTPDGRIVDILRVDTPRCPEKAAILNISKDGKTTSFDPATGFIDFPGGAKKFSIRFDPTSKLYWTLASVIPESFEQRGGPGAIRNTLALTCSPDLTHWTVRCILLHHQDVRVHGFQYVDWQFDGNDIIAACRTAYDDDKGGAHNFHDANYLTFHRIENFRAKTQADSVPLTVTPAVQTETKDMIVKGHLWTVERFADNAVAFANRAYVWKNIPASFQGWKVTQTYGGDAADITVKALRDVTLYVATAKTQKSINLSGWTVVPDATFFYDDKGKTPMAIYSREVKAGSDTIIPQGNWTGTLLLLPSDKTAQK